MNIRFVHTIDITSIEPKSGSFAGGTILKITGNFFGNVKSNVNVKVAGVNCKVLTCSKELITCRTGFIDVSYEKDGLLYPGI